MIIYDYIQQQLPQYRGILLEELPLMDCGILCSNADKILGRGDCLNCPCYNKLDNRCDNSKKVAFLYSSADGYIIDSSFRPEYFKPTLLMLIDQHGEVDCAYIHYCSIYVISYIQATNVEALERFVSYGHIRLAVLRSGEFICMHYAEVLNDPNLFQPCHFDCISDAAREFKEDVNEESILMIWKDGMHEATTMAKWLFPDHYSELSSFFASRSHTCYEPYLRYK